METVHFEDVDDPPQPAAVMRRLTEPLGATDLAINYYELEPGDSFAFAYHSHANQEELFYVQEGTATFETESGTVEVESGEVIRFEPGEFQRGWNRGDERVVGLVLGAPRETGESVKLRHCPTCDERTPNDFERVDDEDAPDGTATVALCETCGTETGRWTKGSMPGTVP